MSVKIASHGVFELKHTDKFTSDPHWGHNGVIKSCARPFCCKHSMNEKLIDNWNRAVHPKQRIFILGDMFYGGSPAFMRRTVARLNGYKVLVKGNHEPDPEVVASLGIDEVYLTVEATYRDWLGKELRILMRHIPDRVGAISHDLHLCGHVHEKWALSGNIINVGVDIWDYEPKTLRFMVEHADKRQGALPEQLSVDDAWEARSDQLVERMYSKKLRVPDSVLGDTAKKNDPDETSS